MKASKVDRTSEKAARTVFEDIYANGEHRREAAKVLAEGISAAYENSHSAWAVTLRPGGRTEISFNLGPSLIASFGSEVVRLLLDWETLTSAEQHACEHLRSGTRLSLKGSQYISVPAGSLTETYARVRDAYLGLVAEAGGRMKGKSIHWKHHSTGILKYLRHELEDASLPDPVYAQAPAT
jgi:hypothetical protein